MEAGLGIRSLDMVLSEDYATATRAAWPAKQIKMLHRAGVKSTNMIEYRAIADSVSSAVVACGAANRGCSRLSGGPDKLESHARNPVCRYRSARQLMAKQYFDLRHKPLNTLPRIVIYSQLLSAI
jgi:hypothetical protein